MARRWTLLGLSLLLVGALCVGIVIGQTGSTPPVTATAPCENGTAVPRPADNPGLVSDCIILLAARDTLRGTETLNWSANLAIGSWEGITVSGTPGRVTALDIDGWNSDRHFGRELVLNGSIPAQLGGLAKLRRLLLPRNALTGAIPAELGNLSELVELKLYSNQLTGGIPPELGRLSNMTTLNLSRNQLSGGVPVELGALSSVTTLWLHNNRLSGGIPTSLGDLTRLTRLKLGGNSLTGCIPPSLRAVASSDLSSLSLSYCTTTTTHTLTTSVTGNGRISPLPGTYSYLSGGSVTVTATADAGWQISSWGDDCTASGTTATCALTMNANRTASVTFERITHTLTVTAGAGGSVSPSGTSTRYEGDEVTLTANWNDATHSFSGWGGACAGMTTTCVLTMDAAKTVTASFAALPATRCATTTASDCIRAVYLGAPGDYAQVQDIPAEVLLTPNSDGRYYVERGQQVTVVTAASLPTGWTRFWLEVSPREFGKPSPVSASRLVPPVGTTYTFTVTEDEAASTLITFDLKRARPFVRPRPDGKPEIGDTVVRTVFSVETDTLSYNSYDTTGAVTIPGSYAFLSDPDDTTTATTTYEGLRDGTTTALLIHESDAHGSSQASAFDTVEAGDLLEWHKADDCFVRYTVTDAMADPAGAAPRKLLGVAWMTYAFTGCSGTILPNARVTLTWGELSDLGGASLPAPVIHGGHQLVPRGWSGTVKPYEHHRAPGGSTQSYQENPPMDVVRALPYWRDPDLPEGWTLQDISTGTHDDPYLGYTADYVGPAGGRTDLEIRGYYLSHRHVEFAAISELGSNVYETRIIAGRPALIHYSPAGENHRPSFLPTLYIIDQATESGYTLRSRGDISKGIDFLIRVATSLFEDETTEE